MASVTFTGITRNSEGAFAAGNSFKFTHATTTGQVVAGTSNLHIIGLDGSYNIPLQYGNIHIESKNPGDVGWFDHGIFTINAATTVTDLPALLGITNPIEDPDLLVVQDLVADATDAKDAAQDAAVVAEGFSTSAVLLTGNQRVEGAKTMVNKLSVENGVDVTVKSTSATNSTGKIGDVAAQQGMWVSNNGQTTLSSSSGSLLLKTGGWGSGAYNVILRSTGEFDAGANHISYSGTDRNVMVLGNDNAITRALGNDPGHAAGLSWTGNNFCRFVGSGGIGLVIGDGANFSIQTTDGTTRTTIAQFPSDGVIDSNIHLVTKEFMEAAIAAAIAAIP